MDAKIRWIFLGAAIAAASLSSGCAGIIEFKTPKEFQGGKVTEDPPGTMLPGGMRLVQPC